MGDTAEFDEEGGPLPDRVFAEFTPGRLGHEQEDVEEEYVDVGSEGPDLYIFYAQCLGSNMYVL
jgi:hypothetical protein